MKDLKHNPVTGSVVDRGLTNATIRRQFFDGMKPAAIARHLGVSLEYVRLIVGLPV